MKRRERKRVVVVGLGQFGRHLAIELAKDCDVLAIDRDHALVTEIGPEVQRALALDARDFHAIAGAVGDAYDEAVVAMSDSMEASLLCVLHLRRLRLKKIYAKAANEDHAQILRAVGADEVVFPERETARQVATQLVNPNLLDFIPLADEYLVMQIAPPEAFLGRSLAELNLRKRFDIFVIAVKEHVPERTLPMPGPDFVVKPSDVLVVIGREQSLTALEEAPPPPPVAPPAPPAASSGAKPTPPKADGA